jgi:hypothetical protein
MAAMRARRAEHWRLVVVAFMATCTGCTEAMPPEPAFSDDPLAVPSEDRPAAVLKPAKPGQAPATKSATKGDAGAPQGTAPPAPPANCIGAPAVETEPNETEASATEVGAAICGAIDTNGDVDVFTLDATDVLSFVFEPDDDAEITVTSPSGEVDTGAGSSTYVSFETGRFVISVASPAGHAQSYAIARNEL